MMKSKLLLLLIISIFIFFLILTGSWHINNYYAHSPYVHEVWIDKYNYDLSELADVRFNTNNRGRMYFDILLNGIEAEAYFDTGNALGICISEQTAKNGNLRIYDYIDIYNSEGELISKAPQFDVESFYIEDKKMGLNSGIIIDGKQNYFGFEPLKQGRITLDYENRKAAVSRSPLPEKVMCNDNRQIFKFLTMEGSGEGYIIIPIKINEQEYYAMVDTGASVSVIDSEIAEDMDIKKNIWGRVKLQGIEIGRFKIDIPSAAVHSQRAAGRGIGKDIMATIGADVLCQFLVTIDYQQKLLVLER